jgi:prevent-host-death family protein
MLYQHCWYNSVMEQISASEFKINCLSVVERVRKTRKPVCITRYGKPVARIIPESNERTPKKRRLGLMAGTIEILGDIVAPAFDEDEWDMLRDEPTSGHARPHLESKRTPAAITPRRKVARRLAK